MNSMNLTAADLVYFLEIVEADGSGGLVEACLDWGMFDGNCLEGCPSDVYVDGVKVIENFEIICEVFEN